MPIKINGATSGSTTITAPATGGDESIELSTALASKLDLAGGKILQVVSASYSTQTNIATTAYADTNLSCSITPSLNTSKVLIIVSQSVGVTSSGPSGGARLKLIRNATDVLTVPFIEFVYATASGGFLEGSGINSILHLDSPSTTSAITYKTQGSVSSTVNGLTAKFQDQNTPSVMVLMEVSA